MRFLRGPLLLVMVWAVFWSGIGAHAQTQTTLYDFTGGTDGGAPEAGLIVDGHGNLFGTASGGGLFGGCLFGLGCGTVFELSPAAGGGWTLTTIYTFQGGPDGADPTSTLLLDAAGNLFGETLGGGGTAATCSAVGCGTIFELSPGIHGGWTKSTLHEFLGGQDGSAPNGGLTLDSAGNLYGTTIQGGGTCAATTSGCGTVFELVPVALGHWKEMTLHRFGISSGDGYAPAGGVIFDPKGNLLGTTALGGSTTGGCGVGCGTVFQLTLSAEKWTESILHLFQGADGMNPVAGVIFNLSGSICGTTFQGGASQSGVVFALSPIAGGGWQFHLVHQFGAFAAGLSPRAGLVLDRLGNLYGAAEFGGNDVTQCTTSTTSGCGVVFELTATSFGWRYRGLYLFTGSSDGNYPAGTPVVDSSGNLFGTTIYRGQTVGTGTVFEIAQ